MKYYRDSLNYVLIAIMLIMVMIVRVAYIYLAHFPMVMLNPENSNILLEIVKFIFPVVSWGIITFAITSIWDGECFMQECVAATTAAMVPYIILAIPVALLTRMLEIKQAGLFSFMNTVIYVWIALLLFIGLMTMNDYDFKQTVKVFLVSLAGVLLLWAVLMLLFTLTYQLYDFVKGILLEFRLRTGL